jgi:hypothetical protein
MNKQLNKQQSQIVAWLREKMQENRVKFSQIPNRDSENTKKKKKKNLQLNGS